jgi:hypothetical protein
MNEKFNDVDIYAMGLHDYIEIEDRAFRGSILRVAGGWIYQSEARGYETITTVFVPFNNEFSYR